MTQMECFGCLNPHLEQFQRKYVEVPPSKASQEQNASFSFENANEKNPIDDIIKTNVSEQKNEQKNLMFFHCSCCDQNFCLNCCKMHANYIWQSLINSQKTENSKEVNNKQSIQKIKAICQECQDEISIKFCESCEQYLCEKCSFKIHNKGKRAKHQLQKNIQKNMLIQTIIVFHKEFLPLMKESSGTQKKNATIIEEYIENQLKIMKKPVLLYLQESIRGDFEELNDQKYLIKEFSPQNFKIQDLYENKIKYPFITACKIIVHNNYTAYQKDIEENNLKNKIIFEIIEENKKKQVSFKHERMLSQKNEIKHHKNFSNFSNVSAISKVENQSILSNEQSDLFQTNSVNLNITLNQNSSILLMGNLSQADKEQKQQKKAEIKEIQKQTISNHHRIYSIREENSHNSANNISSSTENSLRKRNKKWPIPYFQPFRIPKYEKGFKYNAQLYIRQLAQKGILMIRRQKAEDFLLDPDLTRRFTRNIGQKQIDYVSYIIQFLSIECLAWVIQSIKEDKMTPNEKLIQSRLKQSFDLKVNLKLWDSIIKYLQSSQYDQDYYENTKNRYVPKINVVKYGEQFLLEFDQRKWAYEDQQLLDEQEEQWKQFTKLITDYFNQKSQITGGRYGCVQYVKLNGPKPLRKCSLGKLSLYVQQAINKGYIRYHKTVIVSNNENNTSMNSNSGIITDLQQLSQQQKDLKIMALQVGLIDMFLQSPPNQPISMAQIPLNLKTKIMFDYNLVQLGFPKLKNFLNTISDKLVLESTKTHTHYEATTNGLQLIQKLKIKYRQTSEHFLSYIITEINIIITHFQSITVQDLYNQLTVKLGFHFDYKIFNVSDFYQFVLYFCSHIITVQFIAGVFLAFTKYPIYHHLDNYQTHKITNSQQLPNYHINYNSILNQSYSKTSQKNIFKEVKESKKLNMLTINLVGNQEFQQFDFNSINTPKFNNNHEKKKMDTVFWTECIENPYSKEDKANEQHFEMQDKFIEENISNILDDIDRSASQPPTVIVNEGPQFNNNQFYLQSKNTLFIDEDSFSADVWDNEVNSTEKNNKMHSRVKSTIQTTSKHSRMYSITQTRK